MSRLAITMVLAAPWMGCGDKKCGGMSGDCIVETGTTETRTQTSETGNDVPLDGFPPVVVRTSPVSGTLDVDLTTDRMEVEFNQAMTDQAWSWVTVGLPIPDMDGVVYETDRLNVATGVVLEPDTLYLAWINSPYGPPYDSFLNADGVSAVPYPLAFHTSGNLLGDVEGVPAAVVSSAPAAGEAGVDPGLTRIEVTFCKDMDPTGFAWVRDKPKTEVNILGEGFDGRTAWAEVTLEAGTTYAVWVNHPDQSGFMDVEGILAAPWLLTFRTAE